MEIKFGKHKGKTFDQVPKSYQLWLLKNNLVHIECAEWCDTNSTFVRVDDDGAPTPIDNSIRDNFK